MTTETKCPCLETCPINMVLKLIGGKWKLQILCALYNDGTTRFNTLKKKMDGISNAALANALKELEEDKLIFRTQYNEIPPRVEYSLAPCCNTLMPIIEQLTTWNYERILSIEHAQ